MHLRNAGGACLKLPWFPKYKIQQKFHGLILTLFRIFSRPMFYCMRYCEMFLNPKMDMQKKVTLDGFGFRADPREHFVKNATLNKNQL